MTVIGRSLPQSGARAGTGGPPRSFCEEVRPACRGRFENTRGHRPSGSDTAPAGGGQCQNASDSAPVRRGQRQNASDTAPVRGEQCPSGSDTAPGYRGQCPKQFGSSCRSSDGSKRLAPTSAQAIFDSATAELMISSATPCRRRLSTSRSSPGFCSRRSRSCRRPWPM